MDVGINGDCKLASQELLRRLRNGEAVASSKNLSERMAKLQEVRESWESKLDEMTNNQQNAREGRFSLFLLSKCYDRA